eukprot:CAMPEP_0185799844 /NCGR_PEP_ID=MMETSP1322-20130828/551_1 /TAXON_ID=265543 /ORGANISM="Minutocellus polymorphus, Strain RCC2270" /LENGTH=458 /DNA_ID=CAMNT_0028495447 /DNA_START=96 /DNA_END=1472 /DNA_ORIENTATION=-
MKLLSAAAALLLLAPSASGFVAPSSSASGVTAQSKSLAMAPPASSAEEDLELTRQIILDFMSSDAATAASPAEDAAASTSAGSSKQYVTPALPQNDLMIRAALGREDVERTPVWLFRQAGRHLPEYREYKEKTGRNFLDMLARPEDVAECTLQPLRRYPLDAAILFSDILVIAEALNVEVTMPGGVGIQVPNPIKDPADLAKRIPDASTMTPEYVSENLGHVIESVKLIKTKMAEEGMAQPLIGFSAAPWTLLFYMVGGSSKKNNDIGVQWLSDHPDDSRRLLNVLTKIIIEYMSAQVEAGANMLQLFEAMGMMIDEANFEKFAMPCLKEIATELKARFPDVPLMVFSRGASFANEALSNLGYDVVTIDGSVDRATARATVGGRTGLQGNYDPRELIDDGSKTVDTVRATAKQLLEDLGPQRLVANLGEGLGGKESPELVRAFVDAIHEESESLIKSS